MFGGTIHILPKYSLVNQLILVLNSNDNAASCNAVCIVVANILGLTQKNEPQGQFMNCPYGKMRLSKRFCVSPKCFILNFQDFNVILGLSLTLALGSHDLLLLVTSVKSTVDTCSS